MIDLDKYRERLTCSIHIHKPLELLSIINNNHNYFMYVIRRVLAPVNNYSIVLTAVEVKYCTNVKLILIENQRPAFSTDLI